MADLLLTRVDELQRLILHSASWSTVKRCRRLVRVGRRCLHLGALRDDRATTYTTGAALATQNALRVLLGAVAVTADVIRVLAAGRGTVVG